MAEDVADFDGEDMGASVAAMAAFLKQPEPAPEQAETEIQPQTETQQASEPEANIGEEVQAPASDETVPDTTPEPAKASATNSPELDAQRQQAAQRIQEAEQTRDKFLNALNVLVPQMESGLKGEFADINSQEDVLKLMQTDAERYNRFVIAQTRVTQAKQAQQAAQADADRTQRQKFEEFQKAEMVKLGDMLPDLKDPTKGPALAKSIQEFALKQGYTAQQLGMASARDFVLLNAARQFEATQKATKDNLAAAQQKAAKAPPVQTPGTAKPQNTKQEKANEAFTRLQKSGSDRDATEVFRSLLSH